MQFFSFLSRFLQIPRVGCIIIVHIEDIKASILHPTQRSTTIVAMCEVSTDSGGSNVAMVEKIIDDFHDIISTRESDIAV